MEDVFELLTRLSSKLGKEVGVCLCKDEKGTLYLDSNLSIGDSTKVVVSCSCEPVMVFHTHTSSDNSPSSIDLEVAKRHKLEKICVGSMKEGTPEVKCYKVEELLAKS